jgi:hypothetical protein
VIFLLGQSLELSNTSGLQTITGPAAGVIIGPYDALYLSRVFQVDAGVTASISGLTFAGGWATDGGGLLNNGTATLTDCTFSGDTAQGSNGGAGSNGGSGQGGAIFNGAAATLTLISCTFSGNTARGGTGGYANVADQPGLNGGSGQGGAIFNASTATLTLTNCTLSGNTAQGGNGGRGVPPGNPLGPYRAYGGNGSNGNGGQGSGGGLENASGTTTLGNTIVAGNTAGTGPDVAGTFTSQGNNLIGKTDGSQGWVGSDLTGTVAAPLNPLLAPLGDYGGPTQTMALLPGSPAINAGASGAGIPPTDQRGKGRVGAPDIGAFESQGLTLTLVAGSTPQTAAIGTMFANPLAVTVTANNPLEPVNGGIVSFANPSAPNSPRAIFPDPNSATGYSLTGVTVTIAGGQASVAAGPNNIAGSYTVVASANGAAPAVSFNLTNAGSAFTSLVVNTTSGALFAGPGLLSLPYAIYLANTAGVASSITFDPTVFATHQTITLSHQLDLTDTSGLETITGPAAGVTVSGGGLSGHGPGGGRDGQRRWPQRRVPGGRGRQRGLLGTDNHRRQQQRPAQLRLGRAQPLQLHRQRQHRRRPEQLR